MKRTIIALCIVFAFAATLVPAFGSATCAKHPAKKPAVQKKVVSAVCPVMKTKIPDVRKAAGKSVCKGKTYYFCCEGCKPLFDKNPARYVKSPKK